MYIHEILEWLAEARNNERSVPTSNERRTRIYENNMNEQSDTECAILNGVILTETRPNNHNTTVSST